MARYRWALLLLVLACYLAIDAVEVPVWRADAPLWTQAAAIAPLKPRPSINLAKLRFAAGDDAEAIRLAVHAQRMARARAGR